jgi:hypothetical protein
MCITEECPIESRFDRCEKEGFHQNEREMYFGIFLECSVGYMIKEADLCLVF